MQTWSLSGKILWRRKWQATLVFLSGKILWTRGAWQATVHKIAKRYAWLSDWTIIILHCGYWLMCLFPKLDIRPLCRRELSLKYLLTPVYSMKLGSIVNFQKYLVKWNKHILIFVPYKFANIYLPVNADHNQSSQRAVMGLWCHVEVWLIELCYYKHTFFIHSHEDDAKAIKKYKIHEISNYGH